MDGNITSQSGKGKLGTLLRAGLVILGVFLSPSYWNADTRLEFTTSCILAMKAWPP